ncbi:hypothetical protein [Halopiger xanaduensis]|uniref:Uncharacterized protein n=1 Tax=Halopiger xanaduensis (strain DSM 18323 / JCM 14033 / SH-6) TaxID=797210 RepID=F8DEU4_HALXS|nr:hypothetical protein [Halopiger xanaduensis]AEH39534.1 hypothetical protein Halxa_0295 [Halopiger xanaduensis SH-6]
MYRILAVCLLLVLVPLTAVAPAAASTAPAASLADESDCTTVRHDAFRTDESTINASQNGTATSQTQNTEVTVDTNVAFVHLSAKNPNGYCVNYVVEISPEVIDPAELGTIDANNGSETATWHAIHDFDADETYTQVEFTLEGGEEATFAPSKLLVKSLKWTGDANNATAGWFPDIGLDSIIGENDLEKRTYTFSAENESEKTVSVSLRNESLGKSVEEYQAAYRTDDRDWTPVGTDSEEPVYRHEVDGGDVVKFTFNDPSAEVEFTANPSALDKGRHSVRSYMSGADWLRNLVPGFTGGMALQLPAAEVTTQP